MMLTKKEQRLRRARQTRIRIATQGVARLTVNRTNLHIYATVISDDGTKVLATASTAEAELRKSLGGSGKGGNAAAAAAGRQAASPRRPRPPASRRSPSTAQVSPTTAASRRWPKRRAKPACSSNGHGNSTWQKFKQERKATVRKTACARR